jgi:hypothetical protein
MEVVMRSKIGALVVLFAVGTAAVVRTQGGPTIQGVWRVTEIVVSGANASSNKTPQPSLYIFTKDHYSIITVNGTAARKAFGAPKDPAKLTDAEKLERYDAWNQFTANAGTYKVSGTSLTTQPIVAKNPSVMGGSGQTREFKIEGKTLTFVQKSAAGQPASETRTTLTRVE